MRCERQVIDIPGPNGGKWTYTDYTCRSFPASVADHCEKENKSFCTSWTSAGYAAEIAIGFAGVSLFTILFGVSTHSRRRRIWKAVAGLVLLHGVDFFVTCCHHLLFTAAAAVFQLVTFGIVTEMYRTSQFPTFEHARPGTVVSFAVHHITFTCNTGTAYALNTVSWLVGILVVLGVITTGISADSGHRWAAGNRAYLPIGR